MGVLFSAISQVFPPKSHFSVGDIPDLSNRVVIVTGGAAGIGKETSKALLHHNAKVYIATRNEQSAKEVIEQLKAETDKEAIFLKLDLADLKSIKAAAEEFQSKEKELHILFNNAGVMVPPIDKVTAQGYDLQFGTNTLGHFYFTKLLLPQLLAGAKSSSDGKARVVNTSSSASDLVGTVDINNIKDSEARKKRLRWKLYSESKLGNILFSNELARRYGDQGIISTSLNPGNIQTTLLRHVSIIEAVMIRGILYPAPYGALTQLYAGTSPEAAELNGKYLIPWARVGKANPAATPELARRLWDWMEEQVNNDI